MLFAGFGVSQGHFSLIAITPAGVLGNLAGSWIAYAAGFYGRRGLVEGSRHTRHLERADRFFADHGSRAVLIARVVPLIRTFISLPAGAARMPIGRFTTLTALGCIPWVLLFAVIGDQGGRNWHRWHDNLQYLDYAVAAAVVLVVIVFGTRRLRERTS